MGLIAAALNAAGGTLASQWKEYFYVDALPDNVLATKAEKKVKARFGGSRREDDNVISDGSVIAVADGQCVQTLGVLGGNGHPVFAPAAGAGVGR